MADIKTKFILESKGDLSKILKQIDTLRSKLGRIKFPKMTTME